VRLYPACSCLCCSSDAGAVRAEPVTQVTDFVPTMSQVVHSTGALPPRAPLMQPSTVLVIASAIQLLLCSGLTLGWAGMLLLLNGERTFEALCDGSSTLGADGTCDESDLKLNLIFTVSSTSYGAAPIVLGMVIDRYGPRTMCVLSSAFLSVGFLLVTVSSYPDFDLFMVGFVLIATFGVGVQFSCFHVANLFPKRHVRLLVLGRHAPASPMCVPGDRHKLPVSHVRRQQSHVPSATRVVVRN